MSFALVGVACMSIAAGLYTLVRRELPPIFPDGEGGRGAPEVEREAIVPWGLGFIAFGILLAGLTWLAAWLRRAV